MGIVFNPFTSNLDFAGNGNGGDGVTSPEIVNQSGSTSGATPSKIFVDGGATSYAIVADSTIVYEIYVVGRDTVNDNAFSKTLRGTVKRDGSDNTSRIGFEESIEHGNEIAGANSYTTVNDTDETLELFVIGDATNPCNFNAHMTVTKVV